MEKLIFTNANGQTVEFSNTSSFKWTQVDDLGAGSVELQRTSSPYQDGATNVGGAYFGTKTVKIDFVIDDEDLSGKIRQLNSILNPKLGLGSLSYELNGIVKVLNKVRTRVLPSILGGESRGHWMQKTYVIFEAFNPLFEDHNITSASVTTGANLLSFPLDLQDTFVFDQLNTTGIVVFNYGDVGCPITVIFDGPKSSPLVVENLTTGEKIVITTELLENERLIITTEIDNINVVKKNLITNVEVVAFQYIDVAQTTFFNLIRGTNTISITANEAAVEEVLLNYKQKYVGV